MEKINYEKLLLRIIENNHHDLDKIKKIVIDSRNSEHPAKLSFEEIVNDTTRQIINGTIWTASEKEELLRLFGYEKADYELEYINDYHSIVRIHALKHMILFNNLSGFTAYMNCFKDIRDPELNIKDILNYIHDQTIEENVKMKNTIYTKTFTKEQELQFMKAALSILDEEDKKRLCADSYVGSYYVTNESIFINVIRTEDISLIDEYIKYVDNISAYLPYAVETKNIEVVQHFLDLGADINYYPEEVLYSLLTPLKTAININDYKMVEFLLDHGADINLSIKENDFIKKVKSSSLYRPDNHTEKEIIKKEVEQLQYARESSPLEFATTLIKYNQDCNYVTFKGATSNQNQSFHISSEPRINKAKIVHLLFEKSNKEKQFNATNLIRTALGMQDTENINQYIDYIKKHNIEIDFDSILNTFLAFHLDGHKEMKDIIIDFISKFSDHPSESYKQLFNIYLENMLRRPYGEFRFTAFAEALLNNITKEERKNLILMPYAKNIYTVKGLLDLGFDINQTDEDDNNILLNLFCQLYRYSSDNNSEIKLFNFLVDINPKTEKRLIDITHKNKENKNALFYALQKINTKDEYRYGSKEAVQSYTRLEDVVADFIEILPKKEVDNPDIIQVLESRMTEYNSDFGDKIYAEYIYQHHKKLMEALRKKMTFTDKMYKEIFENLYPDPNDTRKIEKLKENIQMDSSLEFLYETLDKNTDIQKLSIDDQYNQYMMCLNDTSFEEYMCILKKLVSDIDELQSFYEQSISKKYDQNRYLDYVKKRYNVSYEDLSSYILKMIIFGIRKYGNDKLPTILELCPKYDINTIGYDIDTGISYYTYLGDLEIDRIDEEGNPIPPEDRFEPDGLDLDNHDNLLLTGSLIHYGILTNDIALVEYLKSIGGHAKLIIEGNDYSWDYVSSNSMARLVEEEVGPQNVSGCNDEEKKYLLSLYS